MVQSPVDTAGVQGSEGQRPDPAGTGDSSEVEARCWEESRCRSADRKQIVFPLVLQQFK
jgi:hypothetical protein